MTNKKTRNRPFDAKSRKPRSINSMEPLWLWGKHAVEAALANADRKVLRLVATPNAIKRMGVQTAEEVSARGIDALLPTGAVHQGVAVKVHPLPAIPLEELIASSPARLAVLDQVSDPHNLGAVFRSAAAFGIEGLVLQTRHSPPITGIVAKAAAGGVETVREARVVNIARALDQLAEAGYTTIGLTGSASQGLAEVIPDGDKVVLVFGAEGAGLRPAVEKACLWSARIEMQPNMESLNISNAAAIAFYEAARRSRS